MQCASCDGQGQLGQLVQLGNLVFNQTTICVACNGEGEVVPASSLCTGCVGEQLLEEQVSVRFEVPPGVTSGERLTAHGQGHQMHGMAAGDVILVCGVQDHERFMRKGDDLLAEQRVPLQVALCGGSFDVQHLGGRTVTARLPRGSIISPGSMKVVPGEGMPKRHNPHLRGDLALRFSVDFPESIPEAVAAQLEMAFQGKRSFPEGEGAAEPPPEASASENDVYLAEFDPRRFGITLEAQREIHHDDEEDGHCFPQRAHFHNYGPFGGVGMQGAPPHCAQA